MKQVLYLLAFKMLCLLYQFWTAAEGLINGFIRYVYIPLFHSNLDSKKIIKDISTLQKKPNQELTLVYEIKSTKVSDVKRSGMTIARHIKIVHQSINPTSLNCYLETTLLKSSQAEEIKSIIENLLSSQSIQPKIWLLSDFNYSEKINVQKKKCTPLVVIFSSYPSVLGIHPSFLVGAQIAFRPQVLRCTDYDLYSSLEAYAASQQRKGK